VVLSPSALQSAAMQTKRLPKLFLRIEFFIFFADSVSEALIFLCQDREQVKEAVEKNAGKTNFGMVIGD
jgi:hypothetical protein